MSDINCPFMAGRKTKVQASKYSIFDIAGPIMVGPSSSHTAGACKLGQIARALFHETPDKVTFILHGSFATVYKGHATDRALLAGVMKFKTSDQRIKNSFNIAKQANLKYMFKTANLGRSQHPNTVKIILEKKGREPMSMIGSSIGGGIVQIVMIDQFDVSLHGVAGQYKTLVLWRKTLKGVLNPVRRQLRKFGIRIHDIQTVSVGKNSLSLINMDGRRLKMTEVLAMEKYDNIAYVRSLTNLEK